MRSIPGKGNSQGAVDFRLPSFCLPPYYKAIWNLVFPRKFSSLLLRFSDDPTTGVPDECRCCTWRGGGDPMIRRPDSQYHQSALICEDLRPNFWLRLCCVV